MASTCIPPPAASLRVATTPEHQRTPLDKFIAKHEPNSVDRLAEFHDDLLAALIHYRLHGASPDVDWDRIKNEDRRTFDSVLK